LRKSGGGGVEPGCLGGGGKKKTKKTGGHTDRVNWSLEVQRQNYGKWKKRAL